MKYFDNGGDVDRTYTTEELRGILQSLGISSDFLNQGERPADSYSRVAPTYRPSGSNPINSEPSGRSPFVPIGQLDPAIRDPGSVMNTRLPYQPPGYTNYRTDPRTPRPFDYQSGFADLGREAYSPYESGTRLAQDYLRGRMDVPTSLTQQFAQNYANYRPYARTFSDQYVPQYTGYNPFSPGSVNALPAAKVNPFNLQAPTPQNPFTYLPAPPVYTPPPTSSTSPPRTKTVFQGSTKPMKKGGAVDLGIAAARLRK